MKNPEYSGVHLLIDAVCASSDNLNDQSGIVDCLEAIVSEVDMTMILPPVTVKFPHTVSEINKIYQSLKLEGLAKSATAKKIKADLDNRKDKVYGFSSFVMIAESHISIHTFPEACFFSFDCYSCKNFDHQKVVDQLSKHFDIEDMSVKVIERTPPAPQ